MCFFQKKPNLTCLSSQQSCPEVQKKKCDLFGAIYPIFDCQNTIFLVKPSTHIHSYTENPTSTYGFLAISYKKPINIKLSYENIQYAEQELIVMSSILYFKEILRSHKLLTFYILCIVEMWTFSVPNSS